MASRPGTLVGNSSEVSESIGASMLVGCTMSVMKSSMAATGSNTDLASTRISMAAMVSVWSQLPLTPPVLPVPGSTR